MGFPGSSAGKESTCHAGDPGSVPRLRRSTGEGVGYPLQYSWTSLGAQMVIYLQRWRPWLSSWVGKIPWRRVRLLSPVLLGFPGGSDGKESACSAGNLGSIPRSGRSPGGGHGNPLQYSCLENLLDRGAWKATVRGVTKSWTQLSD